MKITDYKHFENEVIFTLENTEVLYNTAIYPNTKYDLQHMKHLTEEVIVAMQENGCTFDFEAVPGSGVQINNFVNAVDCAFPVVVDTARKLQVVAR